jgi:hypothetical protein
MSSHICQQYFRTSEEFIEHLEHDHEDEGSQQNL